jgi:Fungal specific transcription factor domain/Fungal Zn(2)-Cys(6) binuclear cluster domain
MFHLQVSADFFFSRQAEGPQQLDNDYLYRVRRIKCDETKPLCVRCTSTGRTCDGYTGQTPQLSLENASSMTVTISRPPGQRPQSRSFDFFRTCTIPNISLHFGSSRWIRLVLQASSSEPALKYAAAAVGAIHEYLESRNTSEDKSIPHRDKDSGYAAQQYTQALISLGSLLTKSDNRSIELALVGALLCMYYEALQENFEALQVHLENCLLVLQSLIPTQGSWLTQPTNSSMQIDNDIVQAFAHLDIEASCTLGKRSPSLCISETPLEIPTPFTSVAQARHILYGLTSQLHSFMRSTEDAYKTNIAPIPLPTIAELNSHQARLKEWDSSFSAFLSNPATKLSRQEQQGANVLSIQQKVTYMKAVTCFYAEEMLFDQFDQEFQDIICLAEYLIYLSNGPDMRKEGWKNRMTVVLSFDMGIIEALFWTAIKCRRSSIRHRAIEMLRKITWQEGVWNAQMMAAIAEKFVEMEEERMYGVDEGGGMGEERGRIPEWLRLHDHGWEMNLKARKTEIRAGRRENGMDGEWTWLREEVTW